MEFLTEYGLFLAKTLTFVVALGLVVAIVAAAAHKNKGGSEDNIEVEKLNDRLSDYKKMMQEVVLDDDALKSLRKEEKKQNKKNKKEKKKKGHDSDNITEQASQKKRVFVADFDGDVKASEAEDLAKLISIILTQASERDEVVLRLESSGGMVHSYGLAASQLTRITQKNIPLTICVDKVAASGGYMMACVADKILAAPFAIVGSIGVIAQIPNFHRLLQKSNVDYEMHTAGEYKRTLTMFGENTDKGREKFLEELEDTHQLFKTFVGEQRPSVNIDDVATGEVWFGTRALDNSLIDAVKTSDEYLAELAETSDVYEISISEKPNLAERLGIAVAAGADKALSKSLSFLGTRYFS